MKAVIMAPPQVHLLFLIVGIIVYMVLALTTWVVEEIIWPHAPLLVPVVFYFIGIVAMMMAKLI